MSSSSFTSTPPLSSSSPSSSFFSAISTVAVAQISQSIGYHGAQSAALKSLSDVAGRYLQSLAALASASATSNGRTDSNVFDVIAAIEHLASPRGFPGASDPARPLLRSSVLKDIASFVGVVDEIPFARPIGRRPHSSKRNSSLTFAQAGRIPPLHVPRWLPEYPRLCGKRAGPEREALWPASQQLRRVLDDPAGEGKREGECDSCERVRNLPVETERTRVRFQLGSASGRASVGSAEAGKGSSVEVVSVLKDIDGDQTFFGSMRTA